MGLVAGYWLGSMLQIFLICAPFEMNWNPAIPGHCASYNVAFVTIGIFNMITDLIIMLLPIPFLRTIQMAIGIKVGLVAIFSIGLLYVSHHLLTQFVADIQSQPTLKAHISISTLELKQGRYRRACKIFWQFKRKKALKTKVWC